MRQSGPGIIERLLLRRALSGWQRVAERASGLALSELRSLRAEARTLHRDLGRVLNMADARLSTPGSSAAVPAPVMSDWAWRPAFWSGPVPSAGKAAVESGAELARDLRLFHDCKTSEITARQTRNTETADLSPQGLAIDVYGFDGSYLSLVLELPESAVRGLKARHVLRISTLLEIERPVEVFARLNIRHGPNTEQIVRQLPQGPGQRFTEFDLSQSRLRESRLDRAWIDLIFDRPEMNRIGLRDLTLARRPRAEV